MFPINIHGERIAARTVLWAAGLPLPPLRSGLAKMPTLRAGL